MPSLFSETGETAASDFDDVPLLPTDGSEDGGLADGDEFDDMPALDSGSEHSDWYSSVSDDD